MYGQYVSIKLVREKKIKYDQALLVPEAYCQIAAEILDAAHVDREIFLVFCLNAIKKINAINLVTMGTINKAFVHPREVFKPAILSNAVSVVLAHNHLESDPMPSKSDHNTTRMLIRAGRILGIEVLDHIVIAPNYYGEIHYWSMKEKDPWLFHLEDTLAVKYEGNFCTG